MGCGFTKQAKSNLNSIEFLIERLLIDEKQKNSFSLPCITTQRVDRLELHINPLLPMQVAGISISAADITGQINKFVDFYEILKNSLADFYEVCHSKCIKDFRLTDGIIIMLISVASSDQKIEKFSSSPPYFKFKTCKFSPETRKIYEA